MTGASRPTPLFPPPIKREGGDKPPSAHSTPRLTLGAETPLPSLRRTGLRDQPVSASTGADLDSKQSPSRVCSMLAGAVCGLPQDAGSRKELKMWYLHHALFHAHRTRPSITMSRLLLTTGAFLIMGCGGSTPAPGPFDGRYIGVEDPPGITPFVQLVIQQGKISGGHITEEDHFVDKMLGSIEKDGTFQFKGGPTGVLSFDQSGRLVGGPFTLLRAPK